jgi:hypothetical protein
VLKAWLENIRKKLRNKGRCTEALEMLKAIVYWDEPGTSLAHAALMIDKRISEFRERFHEESPILDYFHSFWEAKEGEPFRRVRVHGVLKCEINVDVRAF